MTMIHAELKKIIIDVALDGYGKNGFVNRKEFKKDIYNIFIIRKMIKRYLHFGVINEKLLMNNIITIFNTFSQHKIEFIFNTILNKEELAVIKSFFSKVNPTYFESVVPCKEIEDKISDIVYRPYAQQ